MRIKGDARGGSGSAGQTDDWFGTDGRFNWPEEPLLRADGAGQPHSGNGDSVALELEDEPAPPAAPRSRPDAAIVMRRRRILAIAVFALLLATGIAVVIATAGGGGSSDATPTTAPEVTT